MRLVLIEGFDYYPDDAQPGGLPTKWNVTGSYTGFNHHYVAGLSGEGQSLQIDFQALQRFFIQYGFTPSNKITLAFALKIIFHNEATYDSPLFRMKTAAGGTNQWGLGFDAAGHMTLWGEGDAIVATSETIFQTNQTNRVCFRADMSTNNATVIRMSVNGDDDAGFAVTVDAQDDASQLMGLFEITNPRGGYILDDLIIGADECVDWGPIEINTQPASADVLKQWTRSAGTDNFANVDDIPFDGDTTYNSSVTVGQKDIFEFGNPVHVPSNVIGVALLNISRKEESATRRIKDVLRIGGVDYLGDEHNLTETYNHHMTLWMQNPATNAPWTAVELNALQGGYVLTESA